MRSRPRGGPRLAVVWGNCQAAPLAELLRGPLAAAGVEVVDVAPVFLADEAELDRVHRLVGEAAVLVSQPIREEYRFGGCGTAALAAELPPGGRLVTVPTTFHTGPFPWLVNAHGGGACGADGPRVDAPIVDYHDLRIVRAASRGLDISRTLATWPAPPADAVRALNAASLDALRTRERALDVPVSDLVDAPGALWSMNHPANRVLAEVARRVVRHLGADADADGDLVVPVREFLAERQAPVEAAVVDALGWPPAAVRPQWVVRGEALELATIVAAHLEFYAARPDVVADTLRRYATRLRALFGG